MRKGIFESIETPCYIADTNQLYQNVTEIRNAFFLEWGSNIEFGYSVKTNNSESLVKYFYNEFGWRPEIVSENEYKLAEGLGIKGNIIVNGPNKCSFLKKAILDGCIINLDNLMEVDYLCALVSEDKAFFDYCNNAMFGLRVNFDLDKKCEGETTSGKRVSRFGLCYENGDIEKAIMKLRSCGIKIDGLHMHCSTRTRSLNIFGSISLMAIEIVRKYNLNLKYLDIGGGFFGGQIKPGMPTMKEYAGCIASNLRKELSPDLVKLILEPGVSVLATAVYYVARVVNHRSIRDFTVLTLDGTLLHINPFMVDRPVEYREIYTTEAKERRNVIIVGSTCLENDVFLNDIESSLEVGDCVVFKNAGAYTKSFNSEFILQKPSLKIMDLRIE